MIYCFRRVFAVKFPVRSNPSVSCLLPVVYILLERKCVREDASVGGNVMNPMRYPILIIAYAWVLSDTFSLQ